MTDEELVIIDADGTEHVFPSGMDPAKAAAIVRGQTSQPQATAPPERATRGMLAPSTVAGGEPFPTLDMLASKYVAKGPGQMLEGAKDVGRGNIARGGASIMRGLGVTALPPAVLAGVAAAGPGIIASPLYGTLAAMKPVVAGTAAGLATDAGVREVGPHVGLSPDQTDLAALLAGTAAGGYAASRSTTTPDAVRAGVAGARKKAAEYLVAERTPSGELTALEKLSRMLPGRQWEADVRGVLAETISPPNYKMRVASRGPIMDDSMLPALANDGSPYTGSPSVSETANTYQPTPKPTDLSADSLETVLRQAQQGRPINQQMLRTVPRPEHRGGTVRPRSQPETLDQSLRDAMESIMRPERRDLPLSHPTGGEATIPAEMGSPLSAKGPRASPSGSDGLLQELMRREGPSASRRAAQDLRLLELSRKSILTEAEAQELAMRVARAKTSAQEVGMNYAGYGAARNQR